MRMRILEVAKKAIIKRLRGTDYKGLSLMFALNYSYDEITEDDTLTWKHHVVGINSPGASITFHLSPLDEAERGRVVILKDIGLNAAEYPHTIMAPSGVFIENNDRAILSQNGASLMLIYNGGRKWWIV